tara:strand:+ start:242 stop:850 length:609 start_codon:yes stop_codon:yes gene_type:complete
MLPKETFNLVIDKGTFDSILCSTEEMGGEGDGIQTASEAVNQAATDAMESAKLHPDKRLAPPYHAYGKHVRNIWKTLKQGGCYLVLSTSKPSSRISKIKTVGHGMKASMEMWSRVTHVKLEKLGTRILNVLEKEDKYHYAYIFIKSANKGVKLITAPVQQVMLPDLLEEEVIESSDDSSDGDLVDSDDEPSSEEESVVSDVS